MSRFINDSAFRPEHFLDMVPLWNWRINDYQIPMIVWNIALGALAVVITYFLVKALQKKIIYLPSTMVLAFLWLCMVPNTAYLLTDARHIIGYCPIEEYGNVCIENAWMVFFFWAFAATGWLTFVWSLRPLRRIITRLYGKQSGNFFIVLSIPLIALGVLLGLINRWNSWEIFTRPDLIIKTSLTYFHDLTYFKNWLIITFLLYIFYVAGERLFIISKWEK